MMKKREFLKELNSLRETSNLFIDVSQDIERLLQDCKLSINFQIKVKSRNKGGHPI